MELDKLNQFTKYEKIKSPFIKDENFKNTSELAQKLPRGNWKKFEKVDGTNIRIIFDNIDELGKRHVYVGSKNNILNYDDKNSQYYLNCLTNININKLIKYFQDIPNIIVIYGEGYGQGIQKGGIYSLSKDFAVFDIVIGNTYQDYEYINKVCVDNQLYQVPYVEDVEELTYFECMDSLKKFQNTLILNGNGGKPEGLIYKFEPVLFNKYHERLIFKIKFKDFMLEK